jgi:phosphatidylserine/phosphatidylglycerophosphate/cardiolipin synthase-like enzyme
MSIHNKLILSCTFLLILLVSGCLITDTNKEYSCGGECSAEVYFCPEDNCSFYLIDEINSAQSTIDVAIYSFTHEGIANALISAKNRGVKVRVIFDDGQSNTQYSLDEKLLEEGIQVRKKGGSGYMHNKFMVVDKKVVGTGSFNYSNNADTKNDENLVLIYNYELVSKYSLEFNELWDESK